MKEQNEQNQKLVARPPIVVVMGHIDHGKTTLLDYIRKANIAEQESGGITQHIGAYEAEISTKEGEAKKITFIDTPGHEVFSKMRSRGAKVADLAVLVIAADDGVKPQTKEALDSINSAKIPYIVALNKTDKPEANIEKIKKDLSENNILIEEWGGKVPLIEISAKTGKGVDELLEMITIVADLEDLKADPKTKASGVVIESNLDPRRGNTATLIIQNGTLHQGEFVTIGNATAPVRIFEDFAGHKIKEASFGQPVRVVGFNILPKVGMNFESFVSKKEAESAANGVSDSGGKIFEQKQTPLAKEGSVEGEKIFSVPIIIKADVAGSVEALEGEIKKLESEKLKIKILRLHVGAISEDDIKLASGSTDSIIVGFKVGVEKAASDLAERFGVKIKTFDIVYEITEWLRNEIKEILPEEIIEKEIGRAKILKIFKQGAKDQIVGGKVVEGEAVSGKKVKIKRRLNIIGEGRIQELEQGKKRVQHVETGKEFGMKITAKTAFAQGDEVLIIDEEKIKPEI